MKSIKPFYDDRFRPQWVESGHCNAADFSRRCSMRTIEMDASEWQSKEEFYDALADALGSFEGHGRNADAFEETMIYCLHLNAIQPPYEVVLKDSREGLRPFLTQFASWIQEAREQRRSDPEWGDDVDVKVIVS